MNIRKATLMDQEKVAELLLELLNVNNIVETKQTFLREINKGDKYIIIEENGKLLGLISWLMHGRHKHGLAELNHVVVTKESRGKGVGKRLFEALVEEVKKEYEKNNSKLRKLFALTRGTNKEAHKFYENMGFKLETTLKEHFYKDKDEHIYSIFFE